MTRNRTMKIAAETSFSSDGGTQSRRAGGRSLPTKLVPVLCATEMAIYQAYLLADRKLTDHDVRQSVTDLLGRLRGDRLPALFRAFEQCADDLISWRIQLSWNQLSEGSPRTDDSDLCRVLEAIQRSIDTWSRPAGTSRGYIKFIEGYHNQSGMLTLGSFDAELAEPACENDEPLLRTVTPHGECSDEQLLRELGVAWLDSRNEAAKSDFLCIAFDLLGEEKSAVVIEVCQHLIGRGRDRTVLDQLRELLDAAWDQEQPAKPAGTGKRALSVFRDE